MERAVENERQRFARDIHDRIGKELSYIRQCLELHDLYSASDPPRAMHKIAVARAASASAILKLSEIAFGVYSAQAQRIEHRLEALADYAATARGTSLVHSVAGDEESIPQFIREEIGLVINEATHNAVMHSGATRIKVRAKITQTAVRARVSDNGSGFDVDQETMKGSTGLALPA